MENKDNIKKDKFNPTSFRLDPDTANDFKSLALELGIPQDKLLKDLLSLFELEKSKNTIGDRKKEIEEFQFHANRIINMFLNSLEINENSEARVKEQIQGALIKKDNLINQLQANNQQYKMEIEETKALLTNTLNENDKLIEEVNLQKENIKNKELLISEYKEKIDTISSLVVQYKEYKDSFVMLKNDISKLTEEKEQLYLNNKELIITNSGLQKNIDLLNGSLEEYKVSISEQKSELNEHKKDFKLYEEKLNMTIEELKKVHIKEIEENKEYFNEKLSMEIEKIKVQYERMILDKDKEIDNLKNKKTPVRKKDTNKKVNDDSKGQSKTKK